MKIDTWKNRALPAAIDLCLIISFAQCVPDDPEQTMKKWKLKCVEETKVDPELVLTLRTGNWRMKNLPLQKWSLCMLVNAGIMSSEGVFRLDDALALVPEEQRANVTIKIDKCLYSKRHLPHETAWNYLKCYNQKKPKEFRLI